MPRIGITGHRGLSHEIEEYVRRELRQLLGTIPGDQLTGISCIADGADSIFAEIVLELGGQLSVVVPATTYRNDLPASHHLDYDRILDAAHTIQRLDHEASNSEAHMDASRLIVNDADELIAVWDGEPARGYGGTADVVAYAKDRRIPVRVVWPRGMKRD
ncbi:hypothetical protein [Protofrankia symbiont of Coriaria ruscifolia]|uniref:hypothetical protein n=1 Tax=Protofrankia symbiont of Coriaria ruscifolia TaxID=1306542 RepID=UPI00104103D8|nr:hypothetical protein [Protofrankia symbiont of Coriaria ruscifolia]